MMAIVGFGGGLTASADEGEHETERLVEGLD
jgi:hypothetical protein